MTDVFVVAPANSESGGPELCHQLVHALNTDQRGRAAIVYNPFEMRHKIPPPYRRYDVQTAMFGDIVPGSTVVLPETYGQIVHRFPGCRVMFWWMSVNNFHRSAGATSAAQLETLRSHPNVVHLYQSEYARGFLASARLDPIARLSDYLATDYIKAIGKPHTTGRRNVLAFNPAKGQARTEKIFYALTKSVRQPPRVVALQGLSRQQMRDVLSEAKLYIDFGEHPGKDRLPREAAALGCCVLTNRRGAAGNSIDVPIPADCKIDDRKPRFEMRAVSKIHQLLDDYDAQRHRFDDYRDAIADEPFEFAIDVATVFSPVMVSK